MISRGVRGCEPFPTSYRTRRRQGLCTPWPLQYHEGRADHAQRRKTFFTNTYLALQTSVLILHADIFAQDTVRFHRTVGSYLDPQAQHPVHLSARLRRERVERLWRHLGVGFKQSIPVPLKLLQDLLAATYGRQLLLRCHAGFLKLG